MRKIVIARGPQGAGKSTLLRRAGLGDHTVSPDAIRLAMGGPMLNHVGELSSPQHRNPEVWAFAMDSLRRRMEKGETIAFDATLPTARDLYPILKVAVAHDYEVLILDFFGIALEECIARMRNREGIMAVNDFAIARCHEEHRADEEIMARYKVEDIKVPDAVVEAHVLAGRFPTCHVQPDDHDDALATVRGFLLEPIRDLSGYDRVYLVGDVQGCHSALVDPTSPYHDGAWDNRAFHVFCGDFLDRGLENAETLEWAIAAARRPNAVFLNGNHDAHLLRWAKGEAPVSKEFANRTLPQIEAAGITVDDIRPLLSRLVDVFPFVHGDVRMLVTHAGLPAWPEKLELVPASQCMVGVGHYGDPVDEQFSRWAIEREAHTGVAFWQAHGHRNKAMLPVLAGPRSFNLEGQVEFGGHLRMLRIEKGEFHPIEIRSKTFRGIQEWTMINKAEDRKPHGPTVPLAPWVKRGEPREPKFDAEAIEAFRAHHYVNENVQSALPHVSSFAFTSKAFFSKSWDATTTKARGLFVDMEDLHIVNRGYSKFFNWGERPETSTDGLRDSYVAPFHGYLKANGFLGLAGYDSRTGALVLSSKSRIDGEFGDMFREIAFETLGEAGLERLMRVLRDQDASAAFEVIDPDRDPHIVKYGARGLVLLDLIWRAPIDETMPYDDLVKIAAYIGVPVKEKVFTIPNFDALLKRVTPAMEDRDWKIHGRSEEGLVIVDAHGRPVKIKTAWYSFWKWGRSIKDRILLSRRTGKPFDREIDDPAMIDFVRFAQAQGDDVLAKDITFLRDAYLADPHAVLETTAPPPAAAGRDVSGYSKGLDALAAQAVAGNAKPESIRRLLSQADGDDDKTAILEAHAHRELLKSLVA